MQNKAIEALANAKGNTHAEILDNLERDGWKLINPALEERESLAREWEDEGYMFHHPRDKCSWCDLRREAWEAIHGPSQ